MERLRRHRVALTVGDHPERPFQTYAATTDWRYVRFHYGARGRGGNYSATELETWAKGELVTRPQDQAAATMIRPFHRLDGWIDWKRSAEVIDRQVRALQPWPGAWTTLVMTPTFVDPEGTGVDRRTGARSAASDARAMIPTKRAAIHRGSWSRDSSARGVGTITSDERQEVEQLIQPRELA